jgi:regulator of protease activity HflC (stomatin/prohibitin superfamily)
MTMALIIAIAALVGVILLAAAFYIWTRYYEARADRTYMTHDERGFKRALAGKIVLWDYEETVVKGPTAPHIEFVGLDPATGGRRNVKLMDPKTGAINLRPHYCAPLPFEAVTTDSHKVIVEARVQFSLNRDLLKHVYEIQEFSFALETRIQSAFRSEIGKRHDEELRRALHDVERNVIDHLRRVEEEGDEKEERGMALGVRFHTANFTYTQPDDYNVLAGGAPAIPPNATPEQKQQALALAAASRTQGVLALRPQQLDLLSDVFKDRDPAATAAILTMLEMQTRQNIAEALAASGNLIVVTPQELGLIAASAQRDAAMARANRPGVAPAAAPLPQNGGIRPLEQRP